MASFHRSQPACPQRRRHILCPGKGLASSCRLGSRLPESSRRIVDRVLLVRGWFHWSSIPLLRSWPGCFSSSTWWSHYNKAAHCTESQSWPRSPSAPDWRTSDKYCKEASQTDSSHASHHNRGLWIWFLQSTCVSHSSTSDLNGSDIDLFASFLRLWLRNWFSLEIHQTQTDLIQLKTNAKTIVIKMSLLYLWVFVR